MAMHTYWFLGKVRVTIVDKDQQEVVVDGPSHGEFFGFASMLEGTPHQTNAVSVEETICLDVDRNDIAVLLQLSLGKQFHSSQQLVRLRAMRNPNDVIEKDATFGECIADAVASFGGSWTFIIAFPVVLLAYSRLSLLMGTTPLSC